MFKKLFGGKSKGKSKDGSNIYTYSNDSVKTDSSVAEMVYTDEIVKHFDKQFPNRKTSVFHEIISDVIHIDINVMEPNEDNPFYVLYTTGMSDLPMTLPTEFEKDYSHLNRAELMIFLPSSWKISSEDFKKERYYWPVRLLKLLARFPHKYSTYLGYGHTIPNTSDYDSYADNTRLSGVILGLLKEDISLIKTKDNTSIYVYSLVPLYKEEMEFKLNNGAEQLFDKLQQCNGGGIFIDPNRLNTCK